MLVATVAVGKFPTGAEQEVQQAEAGTQRADRRKRLFDRDSAAKEN
jgi:hypothetical protein